MASVVIINTEGAEVGSLDVSDAVFGAELNAPLLNEVARGYLNNKRQGTHKTKERGEVRGGGRKPFRQKGTGNARQGTIRAPQMRGGGTVFGPRPRSYRQAVPLRTRRQALRCILSDRVRSNNLRVLQGLEIASPKTKPFASMVGKVAPRAEEDKGIGRVTLFVTEGHDENVLLSVRNIPQVEVRAVSDVNALDVLRAGKVLVQEEAMAQLEARLG